MPETVLFESERLAALDRVGLLPDGLLLAHRNYR